MTSAIARDVVFTGDEREQPHRLTRAGGGGEHDDQEHQDRVHTGLLLEASVIAPCNAIVTSA